MESLEGIADADAVLGRPFPLPDVPLPLTRWVEVRRTGPGAEVEWNLDDTRPGRPGRLALYAAPADRGAAPDQLAPDAERTRTPQGWIVARDPLPAAQDSLRPVLQVTWEHDGLALRLTAQGPWELAAVLRIVGSLAR
ncbi:MAG: hypothetical protein JWM31_2419 [Solirubrobacterales bacterium]|nr:hypothetical protein [Solirubrobacterales bacterium]